MIGDPTIEYNKLMAHCQILLDELWIMDIEAEMERRRSRIEEQRIIVNNCIQKQLQELGPMSKNQHKKEVKRIMGKL